MPAKETPMEKLVGSTLLSDVDTRKPTKELLKSTDFVLLYFSASWCPPCRRFSPMLGEFYKQHAKDNKFEIIYVSSDRDLPSFQEYYGKMPFLAIPAEGTSQVKNSLAEALNITGIPSLVVLDTKTGYFITDNARAEVTNCSNDKEKAIETFQKWKDKTPVPLDQAVSQQERPSFLMMLFQTILTKPHYLIGLIYIVKVIRRNWPMIVEKITGQEGGGEGAEL